MRTIKEFIYKISRRLDDYLTLLHTFRKTVAPFLKDNRNKYSNFISSGFYVIK